MLESMSGATASQDMDAGSSFQASSEVSDGECSFAGVMQHVCAVKKKNYTDPEMEVLVDEIIANYRTLFPAKSDKCPMVVRSAAWNNIMMKVNSVGVAKRTVPELKKKWSDMKKKVKAKMAAISRYARQTGGGPSCPEKLSEEKVGSTCRREQVEGFGLADVCMQALTTSEFMVFGFN
ncbi:nuclear apoptosis-inducing factor 1-like [Hyla sarda]|uniref:nuclear apoptosis-inducing factor 1-like n=1 Tax=Hyla sarda TaxID=327740 RepID=UPI0024C294CA|nr:nuclear apoptosis-inducing factor 1-like [Hyla sarda]